MLDVFFLSYYEPFADEHYEFELNVILQSFLKKR